MIDYLTNLFGTNTYVFFAVAAGFCAGVVVYLMYAVKEQAGNEKYSPKVYALLVPIIGTIVFTLIIAVQAVNTPLTLPKSFLPWLYLSCTGVFFALTNLAIYTAFQHINLSIFAVIFRLNIVLVLIVGILKFDEKLDIYKAIGITIILIAVIMMVFERKDKRILEESKDRGKVPIVAGGLYALGAAVAVTFAVALNKLALNNGIHPFVASWGNYFFQLPFLYLAVLLPKVFDVTKQNLSETFTLKSFTLSMLTSWIKYFLRNGLIYASWPLTQVFEVIKLCTKLIIIWAVFIAFGWGGYIYAFQIGNISIVQPIFQGLQLIVPALFGILVLKEKDKLKENGKLYTTLVCLVLTVGGIILISLGK